MVLLMRNGFSSPFFFFPPICAFHWVKQSKVEWSIGPIWNCKLLPLWTQQSSSKAAAPSFWLSFGLWGRYCLVLWLISDRQRINDYLYLCKIEILLSKWSGHPEWSIIPLIKKRNNSSSRGRRRFIAIPNQHLTSRMWLLNAFAPWYCLWPVWFHPSNLLRMVERNPFHRWPL